jgi:hypothetical protein
VPAAFTLVDDIEHWLGPKVAGILTSRPPATHPTKPHPVVGE